MPRTLKIVLLLVVFVIIVLLAVPLLVPVEKFEGPVLAQVQAATGRKVTIGKLSLSILPMPSLEASDVTIGNPSWLPGNMITMDRLKLGVELMPLLHKEVRLTEITLEKPVIQLKKQGNRANWQIESTPASGKPAAQGTPGSNGSSQSSPQAFYLSHLSIKNGSLSLDNSGSVTNITDVNVTLSAAGEKQTLDGSATVNGQKASLTLALASPMDALAGTPSDGTLKASYQGLDLSWKGTFALKNNLPVLTGTLDVPQVDTTAMQSSGASGGTGAGNAAPKASGHWSDDPINLSSLAGADVDLAVSVDKLKLKKASFSDVKGHLQLFDGSLRFTSDEISAYSGKFRIAVAVNSANAVSLSLSAAGLALGPLLEDFAGSSRLSGTLDAQCALTTQGISEHAMVNALNGNGNFSLKNGTYRGVDLNAMMHNVVDVVENKNASTSFSSLTGSFTAKNGVISNSDLMLASSGLKASGAGSADLPNWHVNYLLKPMLVVASLAKIGPGVTVPLRIEGPLDNPSYRPDLASALKENLENPAGIKDNLNQLKQNILNPGALKGLLNR